LLGVIGALWASRCASIVDHFDRWRALSPDERNFLQGEP
jgi:hypothetical protein